MSMEAWDALGKLRLSSLWSIMMVGTISGLRTPQELDLRVSTPPCDDVRFYAIVTSVSHPIRVRLRSHKDRLSHNNALE